MQEIRQGVKPQYPPLLPRTAPPLPPMTAPVGPLLDRPGAGLCSQLVMLISDLRLAGQKLSDI